jgi:hypothetical protein
MRPSQPARKIFLSGLCVVCSASLAAQDPPPLPEKLVVAKSVYLVNNSGDLKAFDTFYQELKRWSRFDIANSRERADVVMVLTTLPKVQAASGTAVEALELKILDPATADVLWSDMTDKWITSGRAPSKLVSNLKRRLPKK